MSKRSRSFPRPLSDLLGSTLRDILKAQGFASTEIISRWTEIAGQDIAAHCEPLKINWPRSGGDKEPQPATLVLRVEGPAALEIQHLSAVILERVNRFFGWRAVGRIAIRQAPLHRRERPKSPAMDHAAAARIAETLSDVQDDELRQALGRLGAAIKRN
ncbi:MAG TPA: DciA family protein [Pseudolabrys sp.]|nr:DciA family protein [Pseudolabrys sp.]